MLVLHSTKWQSGFVFSLILLVLSAESIAVPPTQKATSILVQYPVEYGQSGAIYSQLAVTGDPLLWDSAKDKNVLLSTIPQVSYTVESTRYTDAGRLQPRLNVSADETRALFKGEPIYTAYRYETPLEIVDLTDPQRKSFSYRETYYLDDVPKISPDSQTYLMHGWATGIRYGQAQDLNSVELAQMFSDFMNGWAQPTGYYSTSIFKGMAQDPSDLESTGDRVLDSDWSEDGSQILFSISEYDGTKFNPSLRLRDLKSNTETTVWTGLHFSELYWTLPEKVFYARPTPNQDREVGFIDLSQNSQTVLISSGVEPDSVTISRDGTLIGYYSASRSANSNTHPVYILDTSTKNTILVEGAAGIRFSAHSDAVVLSRATASVTKPQDPFLLVDNRTLLSKVKNGKVTWADMESVGQAKGEPLLAYDLPTSELEFLMHMKPQPMQVRIGNPYVTFTLPIKNTSENYFHFDITQNTMLHCEVYDASGNRVSSRMHAPTKPPRKHRAAPGSLSHFSSPLYISTFVTGEKVKASCRYGNYTSTQYESELTL
jgi:hypothetical protein